MLHRHSSVGANQVSSRGGRKGSKEGAAPCQVVNFDLFTLYHILH